MPKDASPLTEAVRRIGPTRIARLVGAPRPTVQSWTERGVPEHWEAAVLAAIDQETKQIRDLAGLLTPPWPTA
jgi:hypothetical protein